MRESGFEDRFILGTFRMCPSVFERSSFPDMLDEVKSLLGSDSWAKIVEAEYWKTGESSIFNLMDTLVIGEFESQVGRVCEELRSSL